MQVAALTRFKESISSLFQFKILINSSENVKTFLENFNLTPAEFLRPFGLIAENKKIHVKSINSKNKMIPEFSLSFYDLEEFQTPQKSRIDETIKEVILNNPPEISSSAKFVMPKKIGQLFSSLNFRKASKLMKKLKDISMKTARIGLIGHLMF